MTKQILTLWSIGVLVLGMSGIAFGQSLRDGNNANGSNNGNAYAYGRGNGNNGKGPINGNAFGRGRGKGNNGNGPSNGYGHGDGIQSVAVPEIDPSGAAYAIALLSGALLVIRGRRR